MHDDQRRIALALMRVTKPNLSATHERRRVPLRRVLEHAREARRCELDSGILVADERGLDEIGDAAAVQRRNVVLARVRHEVELAFDLALDEAPLVSR